MFVLDVVQNGIVSSCVHVIAVDLDAVNLDCALCSLPHCGTRASFAQRKVPLRALLSKDAVVMATNVDRFVGVDFGFGFDFYRQGRHMRCRWKISSG